MSPRQLILATSLLLLAESVSAMDDLAKLCSASEVTIFSCRTTSGKGIALCTSSDIGPKAGYIQYRFGTPKKVELVLPENRRPPLGYFKKDFQIFSRGSYETSLTYSAGAFTFQVYSAWLVGSTDDMNNDTGNHYGNKAGVRVGRGEQILRDIKCKDDDAFLNDPRDLDKHLPEFLREKP